MNFHEVLKNFFFFFLDIWFHPGAFNCLLLCWTGTFPSSKKDQDGIGNYVHSRFS